MADTRAASRAAPFLVYGAGLAQGLALVSFPAASSILTSPSGYDLSTAQYGLMFLPQVVLAITAAALSPVWARRWSLQRVLQAGLAANLLAMLLLVASQFAATSAAAYPILLCATAALGFGFGCTVPALNTFAEHLDPARQDRSVLTLNALLGNWSSLYLVGERGLSAQVASLALAAFWASVTLGRVLVAALTAKVPATVVYLTLPMLIAAANVAVSAAGNAAAAVLAYAAAGFACSAMLPLSLSLAGQEFPRLGATSSGELIAGYQVGYGITASGVAPLERLTGIGLAGIYIVGAGVAVALTIVARMVTAPRAHDRTAA